MSNPQLNAKQAHLYAHRDNLPVEKRSLFEQQIKMVDFNKIDRLYDQLVATDQTNRSVADLTPIMPAVPTPQEAAQYQAIGQRALREGKVAALLLAGGQGSRLGHDGPKGTFDIGVAGGRSLFELHANYLKRQAEQTGYYIDWLIMTSAINHTATVNFFEKNAYFGYPAEKITFFEQGMIEAVDFAGKIIIEDKLKISRSPDGNGGCFKALKEYGLVDKLLAKGYQWLFVFNVDNAIVNIADPLFIGFTIQSGLPCAAKVVEKTDANEKVGVPCLIDGKPTIVEYSELTAEQARQRTTDGRLWLRGANIGNYCLDLKQLQRYLSQPLQYHLATKKIAYFDGKTSLKPTEPNGYKFELFIFDIFPAFSGMAVLQVDRAAEFAPVKNAIGADSPQTARLLYQKKYSVGGDCE